MSLCDSFRAGGPGLGHTWRVEKTKLHSFRFSLEEEHNMTRESQLVEHCEDISKRQEALTLSKALIVSSI